LDLSNNQISNFPEGQFCLPKLNELNLNHNRLVALSTEFFGNLTALTVLALSSNHLTNIDIEALECLKALKTLDLSNNDIKMVPPALGKLDLDHLQLLGNSFRIPRADVLQKGTSSILQYLRDRIVELS
jgi:Leucine-rich repeat (LRR) protein